MLMAYEGEELQEFRVADWPNIYIELILRCKDVRIAIGKKGGKWV